MCVAFKFFAKLENLNFWQFFKICNFDFVLLSQPGGLIVFGPFSPLRMLRWLGYLWPWPLTLNFQGQIVYQEWEAPLSWNEGDGSQ